MNRKLTDFICLIVFIVFAVTMVGAALYGYSNGNPSKLFSGIDSDGNFCGSGNATGYPYLYFWDLTADNWYEYGVCVTTCPTADSTIDCLTTTSVPDCNSDSTYHYDSYDFFGKYCLPGSDEITEENANQFTAIMDALNTVSQYLSDLVSAWAVYLISIVTGFLLLVVYAVFVKYCAGIITWLLYILLFAFLVGLGYFTYVYA